MDTKTKALLASYGRAFACAALAAFLTLGTAPLDLRLDDLVVLGNAGIGALVITAVNYFRAGETRFGRGSADLGMGGADVLEPPKGKIDPQSLSELDKLDGVGVRASDDDFVINGIAQLVQTDNRPRQGDPEPLPLPDETFHNEMR